ncbi:MAG TPA: UDP-N-acetylglucosamine 2-epimerase (non-hydrolyzing) [Isosphaeraceae bacterium]|nr:UDP-N-acetylglucosamine 2-epimerase (non-hydrolyzing) [Isosphaeraceae bacterium]
MKTVAVVIGTRPEAIKLAPVVARLGQEPAIRTLVCLSGQHRAMLGPVLDLFDIRADVDLDLLRPGQSLAALTARGIERLDGFLDEYQPDLVLAQGDTTTVLCAALASFYRRIPFGHVEAGLRTGDLSAPWPEEANRVLATRLAALHFAPTAKARDNLLHEGVDPAAVLVTGNTGIDALFLTLDRQRPAAGPWEGRGGRIVLVTAHRRENFGAPLVAICQAVADLADRFPGDQFVLPVHPNPNVGQDVRRILGDPADPRLASRNVHLVEPLDYGRFVPLLAASTLILTDSGGIQEEAPSLGKPVLVLRESTERPEAVEAGTVRLVGHDRARIVRDATTLLTDPDALARMSRRQDPFGDGHAAPRIVDRCRAFLGII